ncbi:MAG: hypothetical protein MUF10_00385 [Thermoanaerobaculaceae bacterium]|nr:hypothetical protein [Thermoanaerobaculaceae bacterium]
MSRNWLEMNLGAAVLAIVLIVPAGEVLAQSQEELAKAAQNPVASMISLPFQNNTGFGYGPDNDVQNVLNIQPVWPFSLGTWNLISRTIVPVVYQPDLPGLDGAFGLGDINESLYFSPAQPGKVIWGVGPTFTLPTATSEALGTEKWSGGLGLVALTMPGKWVFGMLVSNQWSFAGDDQRADVNSMTLQYFVNYNFSRGFYFTSAPINTANWEASSEDCWTVPVGGGFGQIFPGKPPVNVQVSAYYNVVKPDHAPAADWTLRLQVQLMFPTR